MNLKISLFNKSLIKSDFKRFWWLSALNAIVIFLFFTFIYLNETADNIVVAESNYLHSAIYRLGLIPMAFIFIFPVVCAAILFSYLNSSNSLTCLHGLPVKRKTFFASHMMSGISLLIIPVVINLIIMLAARIDPTVAKTYYVSHLVIWAGQYILYSLVAFTASSAVAMLTGNSIAGIVFTYIFGGLPIMAEFFVKFFFEMQLYGYSVNYETIYTQMLYVMPYNMYTQPINVLKYILFAVIFTIIAYWFYKIRKLENNGEIIVFQKLRPLFTCGVAICTGAVGYAYFYAMWASTDVLQFIPFGIIGIIAAEMIQKKTLKVKSAIKPAVLFCVAIFVVQLAFQLDIFGYEKRIPAIENISSVNFNTNINSYNIEYTQIGERIYYDNIDTSIKTPETIDAVVQLHKKTIKEKNKHNCNNPMYFDLTYNLKNGKTLCRSYNIDISENKEYLKTILESEEMKKVYFPILNETPRKTVSLIVQDERVDSTLLDYYTNNSQEINQIIDALKKDTSAVTFDEFVWREPSVTSIRIGYTRPAHYENGKNVEEEKLPIQYETYYIRKSYENVKNVLFELGAYDKLPKAEDIQQIEVHYYSSAHTETAEEEQAVGSEVNYKIIDNPEDIEVVYNYLSDNGFVRNGSAIFTLKNGINFNLDFDLADENLPEILKQ